MRQPKKVIKDTYTNDNEAELIIGGDVFFKRLKKLINEAQHFICFQTYIFDEDETGRQIQQALIGAAKRNVKIYLLLDAYGSSSLSKSIIDEMIIAGIEFRFYGKYFSSWHLHLWRRMHHKIVVADGFNSLVGGINIADKYNNINGHRAWLDFAVACKGLVSQQLHLLCVRKWKRQRIRHLPAEVTKLFLKNKADVRNGCKVSVCENDFLRNKHQISRSYSRAFNHAQSDILICGGYFMPGFTMLKKIAEAVKRGVTVKIITGAKSDVALAKYARQYLYAWMVRHGIEIYEYQKSVVHAKVAVVDGRWATIGSYDLNNLSASVNIELNLNILNDKFAENFHTLLSKIIADDCVLISRNVLDKKNTILKKLKMWFSYRIVRMFFWFSETIVSIRKK